MNNDNRQSIATGAVLSANIVGFSVLLVKSYNDKTAFYIIATFALIICSEKLTNFIMSFREDKDHHRRVEFFDKLPIYLRDAHDIVYLPTRSEGLEHCIRASQNPKLRYIKNTSLRYGSRPSATDTDSDENTLYLEWTKSRDKAASRGKEIFELVSKHYKLFDPGRRFFDDMRDKYSTKYHLVLTDDVIHPMLQMSIFAFPEYKEILFGWDYPGAEEGVEFLSRNPKLVEFFENYFNNNFNNAKERAEQWSEK
jgi:hypothetical protein